MTLAVTLEDEKCNHDSHLQTLTVNNRHITVNEPSIPARAESKGHGKREARTRVALPGWLKPQTWHEFVEHRRALQAPMTKVAQKRAILALERLRAQGHDPEEVLGQSIVNGWRGLFPLKSHARSPPNGEKARVAHPVLTARQAVLRQTERQSNWNVQVHFGYAQSQTLETAAGPNASFTVSIPLFDRSRDLKLAAARTEMAQEEDMVLTRFLADVAALKEHAGHVAESGELEQLYRDRLTWWKKAVEEGVADPERLWSEAEQLKKAGHAHRQAEAKRQVERERIARQYGGNQWTTLRDLLVAITN